MCVNRAEPLLRHDRVFSAVQLVVCVDAAGVRFATADGLVVRGSFVDLAPMALELCDIEGSCVWVVGVCDMEL